MIETDNSTFNQTRDTEKYDEAIISPQTFIHARNEHKFRECFVDSLSSVKTHTHARMRTRTEGGKKEKWGKILFHLAGVGSFYVRGERKDAQFQRETERKSKRKRERKREGGKRRNKV